MSAEILIIDDEEIITKSLQKLLKKNGYSVTAAHNGQEALDKVRSRDFDLIICDVRIPAMDGIEIIKAIRGHLRGENKPAVPEILITGYADEEKYKNAVNLKVADYIYKPFDTNEFLETVKKNLCKK